MRRNISRARSTSESRALSHSTMSATLEAMEVFPSQQFVSVVSLRLDAKVRRQTTPREACIKNALPGQRGCARGTYRNQHERQHRPAKGAHPALGSPAEDQRQR